MRVEIFAKLNLCLNVTGVRGNKHEIDGLFFPTEIKDVMYAEKADGLTVEYDDGRVYAEDTAVLAGRTVIDRYNTGGARFLIKKGIPEGAGLGGSSADAGAVARFFDQAYDLGGIDKNLLQTIGSDVPYFYLGKPSRVRGLGEIIQEVDLPPLCTVVAMPKGRVNTAECYRLYDEIGGENGDVGEFIKDLQRGKLPVPFNALRRSAERLCPEITDVIRLMEKVGFVTGMTGSGSGVFGMENDEHAFRYKVDKLREYAPNLKVL